MNLQNFSTEIQYQGYNLIVSGTLTPAMVTDWDQPDEPAEIRVEVVKVGDIDITEMLNNLYETVRQNSFAVLTRAAIEVIADLVYEKLEL